MTRPAEDSPIIVLSIIKPTRLSDLADWADLADRLGVPADSPVTLTMTGAIETRVYLDSLPMGGQG